MTQKSKPPELPSSVPRDALEQALEDFQQLEEATGSVVQNTCIIRLYHDGTVRVAIDTPSGKESEPVYKAFFKALKTFIEERMTGRRSDGHKELH